MHCGNEKHSYFFIEKEAVAAYKLQYITFEKSRQYKKLNINPSALKAFLKSWTSDKQVTANMIFEECGVPFNIIHNAIDNKLIKDVERVGKRYYLKKIPFIIWLNTRLENPIAA